MRISLLKSLGCIAVAAFMFRPLGSCVRIVEEYHRLYNSGAFGEIYSRADEGFRDRVSAGEWEERCRRLRGEAGAFVRVRSMGHMVSFRSLTTITVELWVASDFERGRRSERVMCVTGLFRSARLLDLEVRDMPLEPPAR